MTTNEPASTLQKQCPKCYALKPFSEYYLRESKPIGCCKACHRAKNKDYRLANFEAIKARYSSPEYKARKNRRRNEKYQPTKCCRCGGEKEFGEKICSTCRESGKQDSKNKQAAKRKAERDALRAERSAVVARICHGCRNNFDRAEFIGNRGKFCRACRLAKNNAASARYRHENPEKRRDTEKRHASTDAFKEKARRRMNRYYWTDPEKFRARTRAFHEKNPRYSREYVKMRLREDPQFAMKTRLRDRVRGRLRMVGAQKSAKTFDLIGCSMRHLMAHLESQFTRGMSWENRDEWEIDHIVPCAAFDLMDPEQQRKCFHFTNLKPMWTEDNRSKGDKIIPCQPELTLILPAA